MSGGVPGVGSTNSARPGLRGAPGTIGAPGDPDGARLFSGNCTTCHGPAGAGSRDGVFPPLFGNSTTGAGRADNLVATILTGVRRDAAGQRAFMPAFGAGSHVQSLTDAEIAALSQYVLTALDNGKVEVTAADVATRRAGGPTAPLVLAVRWSLPLMAAAVVALIAVLIVRRSRRRNRERERAQ